VEEREENENEGIAENFVTKAVKNRALPIFHSVKKGFILF